MLFRLAHSYKLPIAQQNHLFLLSSSDSHSGLIICKINRIIARLIPIYLAKILAYISLANYIHRVISRKVIHKKTSRDYYPHRIYSDPLQLIIGNTLVRISSRIVLNILASRRIISKLTILIARISTCFIAPSIAIIRISRSHFSRPLLSPKRYLNPIYARCVTRPLSSKTSSSPTLAIQVQVGEHLKRYTQDGQLYILLTRSFEKIFSLPSILIAASLTQNLTPSPVITLSMKLSLSLKKTRLMRSEQARPTENTVILALTLK